MEKKNSYMKGSRTLTYIFIGIVIFIIPMIYNGSEINKTNMLVQQLNSELSESQSDLKECNSDINKMNERLEGIKNPDDLLKRDIFLYIDKKFQLIPKTISMDIAEQIVKYSKLENISPELVLGVIEVESSFNPMVISSKKARGLMQLMPEWGKKFGIDKISDFHDIDTNIKYGIKVLKIHIKERKGSITKGLYYYVGKSDSYASKVYESMGKFVAFRSTIDDSEDDLPQPDIQPESIPEGELSKNNGIK